MISKIESSGQLCPHYLWTRVVEWWLETYICVWNPSEHSWMRRCEVAPNWVNWFPWIAPNRTPTQMRRLYPHNPLIWYLIGYLKTGKVNRKREKRALEQSPHVDSLRWCLCHQNKDCLIHFWAWFIIDLILWNKGSNPSIFSRGYFLEGYKDVPSLDQWR